MLWAFIIGVIYRNDREVFIYLLHALDDDFENIFLALLHKLKCLLGFLELEAVGNQSLNIDFARCYEFYSRGVAAGRVSDRTFDVQRANAGCGDGEYNILSCISNNADACKEKNLTSLPIPA
jgi:hypothetical protein